MMHINIPSKIYIKVSANCRSWLYSKIPFPSVNSCLRCHVHWTGCCRLQNGCQLHYHAADCVLTCGWTFISQQIWSKICITHVILGISIKIDKWRAEKRSMYIHISGWHTICFGALSSLTAIRWGRTGSGPRWRQSWWRCTRVTVTHDCGRVTAILYSQLATRFRCLAMILPIHQFTITRVHVCNHTPQLPYVCLLGRTLAYVPFHYYRFFTSRIRFAHGISQVYPFIHAPHLQVYNWDHNLKNGISKHDYSKHGYRSFQHSIEHPAGSGEEFRDHPVHETHRRQWWSWSQVQDSTRSARDIEYHSDKSIQRKHQ